MKKLLLIFFMAALLPPTKDMAQSRTPFEMATDNEDGVIHIDRSMRHAARPGQLLVKFKDYSDIKLATDAKGKSLNRFVSPTKSLGINAVLDSFAVDTIEQLLPNFKMPKKPRVSKSWGGKDVVEHDLGQIHLITLDTKGARNEYDLMAALEGLDEVEFAEPNYLCFALGSEADEETSRYEAEADATAVRQQPMPVKRSGAKSGAFTPNDPMYSQQWGIRACKIDSLLAAPKLDTTWRPIIAIIDTGVDIDHPDLKDNIWTNSSEQNGAEGQDDDGNGFVDDVHGWDFVNQTGAMRDNNSHGTHCAGIAGAVTNNGIGVAGACPDALIMPITVLQSDGYGDAATVIKGINYAAQNGADIISMSIGGYLRSIAEEQALAVAYQTAVIVAAAGNESLHIDPRCCENESHKLGDAPIYPGSLSFVLGVQATKQIGYNYSGYGKLTSFSNIDCDGPYYSEYDEELLLNYELSAPGNQIISTVPNGQYRNFNGTSMATPLVAGGIASLLQRREYVSTELLFGELINNSREFMPVDFWAVYQADTVAPPLFQCVAIEVNDTAYGDGSMYADAGERIQLYPTIRSVWGDADSISIWLECHEFEDTSKIHIIQNHVPFVYPLSSYAKNKSKNPIDLMIDSNVVDGRRLNLDMCATTPGGEDTMRHNFILKVTNGEKLHGMINHNITLYPNKQYIVTQTVGMPAGDTMFVMPGTTVRVQDGCAINATIVAIGKPDSMITFTKTDLGISWMGLTSNGKFEYCNFEYMYNTLSGTNAIGADTCTNSVIRDCYTYSNGGTFFFANNNGYYAQNNITRNFLVNHAAFIPSYNHSSYYYKQPSIRYCNIINNDRGVQGVSYGADEGLLAAKYRDLVGNTIYGANPVRVTGTSYVTEKAYILSYHSSTLDSYTMDSNYFGTYQENTIRNSISDFNTPGSVSYGHIDLSKRMRRPDPRCHGTVWKVEVDGYDAQEEYDSILPLGVGTHEFSVVFNRAMDTSVSPMLAMGVRPPYTQTPIHDDAYWSADSTTYTAHLTLTGRDAIDGINRIYVANARDNEFFEMPFENSRFNVIVASSGSMSAGFQATPGIGKVDLEWNDQEVNYEDFLGFNMYRYQLDSTGTSSDTTLLNTSLIQDTTYTDYDVVSGERYYYFYRILSTSLTENSPSKVVSCVPNSSIRGDANGSYNVDVADVITAINHVTGQNPQPFLFEAADVNGDGVIDVLDIVGIINIILHGDRQSKEAEQQTAVYTVEDGVVFVDSPVALGGLQFRIEGCTRADVEPLAGLEGFELVSAEGDDGSLTLLAYSMSGRQVEAGKTALLRIGDKELGDIVLSDPEGHNVIALKGGEVGVTDVEAVPAQFMKAFPNPFSQEVQIEFVTAQAGGEARIVMTDMTGRTVATATVATPTAGRYRHTWNAAGQAKGVYFATLYVGEAKAHTIKLIVK